MPDWLWFENVVFPILGMGMGVLVMVGVYRIVNKWLDRRHERAMAKVGGSADPAFRAELDELRDRVEMTEEVGRRLGELEERLDFAERVLTQHKERDRIAPGD